MPQVSRFGDYRIPTFPEDEVVPPYVRVANGQYLNMVEPSAVQEPYYAINLNNKTYASAREAQAEIDFFEDPLTERYHVNTDKAWLTDEYVLYGNNALRMNANGSWTGLNAKEGALPNYPNENNVWTFCFKLMPWMDDSSWWRLGASWNWEDADHHYQTLVENNNITIRHFDDAFDNGYRDEGSMTFNPNLDQWYIVSQEWNPNDDGTNNVEVAVYDRDWNGIAHQYLGYIWPKKSYSEKSFRWMVNGTAKVSIDHAYKNVNNREIDKSEFGK